MTAALRKVAFVGAPMVLSVFVLPTAYTQTFAYTGNLRHDRAYHTETLITAGPNAGKVLIAGGLNNDKDTMNSAELYDPNSGSFSYTGTMQHDRAYHAATLLADGQTILINRPIRLDEPTPERK